MRGLLRRLRWALRPPTYRKGPVTFVCEHTVPGDVMVMVYRNARGVGAAYHVVGDTPGTWTTVATPGGQQ